jgi:hypothetical protein
MQISFLIATMLTMITVNSVAQRYPLKGVHTYKQRIAGGRNEATDKPRQSKTVYHIYLEQQPGYSVTLSTLWINGQQYQFDTAVAVTPVTIESSLKIPGKNSSIPLVAETPNRVLKVQPLRPSEQNVKQPSHLKGYEVLMKYTSNGKIYYAGRKECKSLQPVLMQ